MQRKYLKYDLEELDEDVVSMDAICCGRNTSSVVRMTSQWHTGIYQLVAGPVTVTNHCAELACSLKNPAQQFRFACSCSREAHIQELQVSAACTCGAV